MPEPIAPEATPPAPTEPPAAAATPPVPTPPVDPAPVVNPWENPEAARAEIERLRKENGAARTNAKAAAADEARKELAQTIGKALGLVEDEPIDPAALTESLTAAQADARRSQVELAVFRSAAAANGDPGALLDSTSFLKSLEAIDPTDAAAVQAAIAAAVASNPRLGVIADVRPGMKPNPAQGSSAGPPLTIGQQIAAATEAGDTRLAMRLKASQALNPTT